MLLSLLKPVALASTLALSTLGLLSRRFRRARYVFHLTLYAGTLGFMSVAGVVISLVATVVGQRFNINYLVARSFYGLASPLVGIRMKFEGQEYLDQLLSVRNGKDVQSAVLVGNHQSFLDILYLGRIFPKRASIMAKRELIWAPLLGQYLAASGAVFVDRKNRQNALAAMTEAGEDMKRRGISLWVFPEGTRSSSAEPKLLPFKKGAFHLAVQAQIPVIPVVCENYHRLFDGKTRFERGDLRIRVLPPIATTGLTADDVSRLAETTREAMLDALVEISAPGPSGARKQQAIPSQRATGDNSKIDPAVADRQRATTDTSRSPVFTDAAVPRPVTLDISKEKTGDDSTEDEMDEDAVLLKRPKSD